MGAAGPDVKSLFGRAVALPSPEEREAYLEQACAGDAGLRAEVESLLRAHGEAGSFLGERHPCPAATTDVAAREGPGTAVGPYTLREQVGEGGMGLVFVAEQQQPVRRKVALKLIKPGMDTRQVVARFEAERQALALMDHPNIARVLDGGETGSGRPYFVMELVRGVPITQFCDEARLGVPERLGLFTSVCSAVQHAHQKGVIHRDLKPANVLVASHDGTPVPKVIDFGVAKAVGGPLTDRTVYTQLSQVVGTPLYMSPEQAGQSGLDVDTRTDIYSLGVLLYELLTGTTPFDRERLGLAGYDEMRRIIREEEPPRPSTRVSTLGQGATTVSAQRQSDPRRLSQLLRGELDWVVMRCLEKDRNRRYESAGALARDVQRYLADEPVHACPPSLGYRLRKFASRNRRALGTAALLALTLLGAVALLAWKNLQLQEKQRQTNAAYLQAAEDREEAEKNFKRACDAVDELLSRVGYADLDGVPHLEPVRKALLEKALAFYQGFLDDKGTEPEVRFRCAYICGRAANVYHLLGRDGDAARHFERGISMLEELTAEVPEVTRYRVGYAHVLNDSSRVLVARGRFKEAEQALLRAVELEEQVLADFPGAPKCRLDLAKQSYNLGRLYQTTKRYAEAEPAFRKAVKLCEQLRAEQPRSKEVRNELATASRRLASLLEATGRTSEAESRYRAALTLAQELVRDDPSDTHRGALAQAHQELGELLAATGRSPEAQEAIRQALKLRRQLAEEFPSLPDYRRDVAHSHYRLALLLQTERPAESAAAFREALGVLEKLAADFPKSPDYQSRVGSTLNDLGRLLLFRLGKAPEARELFERAARHQTRAVELNPKDPKYRYYLWLHLYNRDKALKQTEGVSARLLELRRQAVAVIEPLAEEFPGEADYQGCAGEALHNLATLLTRREELPEARRLLERAIRFQRAHLAARPGHVASRRCLRDHYRRLADRLTQLGQKDKAGEAYRQAIAVMDGLLAELPSTGEYHTILGGDLHDFSNLLDARRQLAQKRSLLERAIRHEQAALKINPKDAAARRYLRNHYWQLAHDLIEAGHPRQAVQVALELPRIYPQGWEEYHRAAGLLARCVPLAQKHPQLPEGERQDLARACGDRAVGLLRQAVANGYAGAGDLRKAAAFEALGPREDFRKLLADLEAKHGKE
jgi:serine/threonine protein kinase